MLNSLENPCLMTNSYSGSPKVQSSHSEFRPKMNSSTDNNQQLSAQKQKRATDQNENNASRKNRWVPIVPHEYWFSVTAGHVVNWLGSKMRNWEKFVIWIDVITLRKRSHRPCYSNRPQECARKWSIINQLVMVSADAT